MDLSVIIVNFNGGRLIADCIGSIIANTLDTIAYEIIVVDNVSTDHSTEYVKHHFHQVHLIENPENRFYSAANNQGILRARGAALLILNPDTYVEKGSLNEMHAALYGDDSLGAVTCRMHFPNGDLQRNCSRFPRFKNLIFSYTLLGGLLKPLRKKMHSAYFYDDWDRTTRKIVEVIPGSAMMIKREAIEKVGLFDERMKMYFSDDDLCWRIRKKGYRLMYLSGPKIIHHEQFSVKQVRSEFMSSIYRRDLLVFTRKHWGSLSAALLGSLLRLTRSAGHVRSGLLKYSRTE